MTAWKDISSYSQKSDDRTPNAFELVTPYLTIRVSRHIHYPGQWVYRINHLMAYPCPIGESTAAEAKATAVKLIMEQLEDSLGRLRKVKS